MAMKKVICLYIAIALAGLLLISCSERTNPPDFPKINKRTAGSDGIYYYPRAYQRTIADNAGYENFHFTESKTFVTKIYTPPDYEDFGTPRPILYLLHDFNGDQNYYFNRMVHRIADSLIYEGEIEQFFIATVDVSSPYGGTWYTNNEFFGHFEDMITDEWIEDVEVQVPQFKIIQDRASRAIGGFGMGGYVPPNLRTCIRRFRHPMPRACLSARMGSEASMI
jgi:enterochelin esterase-like enzyme